MAARDTNELFEGAYELPEDESRIAFDFKLSHGEKLARLQTLHASKRTKAKASASGLLVSVASTRVRSVSGSIGA